MEILKTGCLAYLDMSESGMIPCRVIAITAPEKPPLFDLKLGGIPLSIKTRVVVTKATRAYKKGEIIECPAAYTVPHKSVFRWGRRDMIAGYTVEVDGRY